MHQFNELSSKPQLFGNRMNSEVTIETQLSWLICNWSTCYKQHRTVEIGKKNYFQQKKTEKILPFCRIFQIPTIYSVFEYLEPLTLMLKYN